MTLLEKTIRLQALGKEIEEFILWLTPCGQVKPAPTHELIGEEARKLIAKIKKVQGEVNK